ncbi:MAG TPA: GNAT family N-acetyltransferase [Stellaceae bacterium]|nr:GNAT family N-acetyltransferase [Stellaceae bacterium]
MLQMLPDGFETQRLVLRPIEPGDAGAIFAGYAQDPDVVRYLSFRAHRTLADTEAYVGRCLATPTSAARTYVLIARAETALIGAFDLRRRDAHRLDCGCVMAQPWWGRGLMTEALSAVAAWAMAQDAIWRLGAVCDIEHDAAARVMEKAGMRREGILRRWMMHPNISAAPRDCFSYAMTR